MISSAIWITSDEAHSFKFTADQVVEARFKNEKPKHDGSHHSSHHADAHESDAFFKTIGDSLLKSAEDRFLILGPGVAKTHFKTYLDKHFPLAKIVGVETVDHLTDGQIKDFAHTFFKKIDSFQN